MEKILSQEETQKFSECLILLRTKLRGWSGTKKERAEWLELPVKTVTELMRGNADGFSLNQLEAIARKAGITARVRRPHSEVDDFPGIKPHKTVDINGIGDLFSGRYYVDEVSHTFSQDGYRKRFDLGRNATGQSEDSEND